MFNDETSILTYRGWLTSDVGFGLHTANWSHLKEFFSRSGIEIGVPDRRPHRGQKWRQVNQVSEDQPQHHVLAVQPHQCLEQGQGHSTELIN